MFLEQNVIEVTFLILKYFILQHQTCQMSLPWIDGAKKEKSARKPPTKPPITTSNYETSLIVLIK